ncbi:hypothetical protein L2E82_19736 [Cichorium intybus]|uniref:Uncharacterized protein n=1 Tax=Cichorium intybus TaxID=13427 RepID=A0ACB9FC66_CICIN|nr:hypothetical protein L2E82_19736 [Cichorium intybus]
MVRDLAAMSSLHQFFPHLNPQPSKPYRYRHHPSDLYPFLQKPDSDHLPFNPCPPNPLLLYKLSSLKPEKSSNLSSSSKWKSFEKLPKKLQEIAKLFRSVQDPKAKYEQLSPATVSTTEEIAKLFQTILIRKLSSLKPKA